MLERIHEQWVLVDYIKNKDELIIYLMLTQSVENTIEYEQLNEMIGSCFNDWS